MRKTPERKIPVRKSKPASTGEQKCSLLPTPAISLRDGLFVLRCGCRLSVAGTNWAEAGAALDAHRRFVGADQ